MPLKNIRGQIAIFVVLIFQVLFILFAMTINIALVVHDKINFQNSLDLAAYYGAKQQAEVLNAMAHINYQMRQNWKLLAWRYRILGTLVQDSGGSSSAYWCPQNKDDTTRCNPLSPGGPACSQAQSLLPYGGGYCDRQYFICISHDLWKRGLKPVGQNLCETVGTYVPIVTPTPMVAPFMAEAHLAVGGTRTLIEEVSRSCPMEGALNGLMAQFFLSHFRLDQRDRKAMLREIYHRSLKVGKDMDGQSIFDGAKKVFFNNLSRANKNNVRSLPDYGLQDFNSFQALAFKDIFEHLNVWPILQFLDFSSSTPGDCNANVKYHYNSTVSNFIDKLLAGDHQLRQSLQDQRAYLEYLFSFNQQTRFFHRMEYEDNPIASLTLGFFKKKDKRLYYGLKGNFKYLSRNQIFSLSLTPDIEFKASSFAKAFGGRFGPQPSQSDSLVPVHHLSASTSIPSGDINEALLQPNYSRWPGDQWGLIARGLHDNNPRNNPSNFLNKQQAYSNRQRVYTMEAFFHLILYAGLADDPLARPYTAQLKNTFMRMMELMAVYPDVYDLSYYSIAGNYMQTYFPRICKLLKGSDCQSNARNKISSVPFEAYIRGDFGWPETDYYIDLNQSKKRVDLSLAPYFLKSGGYNIDASEISLPRNMQVGNISASLYPARLSGGPPALTQGRIFYHWLAQELPAHLLSSWTSPIPPQKLDYEEYVSSSVFPDSSFLKCKHPALKAMPVPSSCVVGGRSDYSVKLISCEAVQGFPSETKKPGNISEYCP